MESIVNMMRDGQGIQANANDIKFAIKITLKNEKNGTESIKVSFYDRRLRDEVYGRRLKLKGTDVFISEDLTVKKSSLAYAAREYVRAHEKTSTWTMDGNILLKDSEDDKPRIIHNVTELKPAEPTKPRTY